MMRIQAKVLVLLLVGFGTVLHAAVAVAQELAVPSVLSDGMVLQQQRPINVWGTAAPGAKVSIELTGDDRPATGEATADTSGNWQVTLQRQRASFQERTLTISSGDARKVIHNVLVGEVWLAAGQSNMFLPVQYIVGGDELLAGAQNRHIRSFGQEYRIGRYPASEATDVAGGKWCIADSSTGLMARDTSGIAYTFALALFDALNRDGREVPVAIVNASTGSTSIHAWLSREALMSDESLKRRLPAQWAGDDAAKGFNLPTAQYNTKVAPLTRLGIRGILWAQGENDLGSGEYYRIALRTLISSWREVFAAGDAPFIAVQLHPYAANTEPSALARFRETQALACDDSTNAVALPIHDLPLVWEEGPSRYRHPIHPRDKAPVGRRMAKAAMSMAYGDKAPAHGPRFASMEKGNGRVVVKFGTPQLQVGGERLRGFALAGADRFFRPAEARIVDGAVEVWHEQIADPVAVSYAFTAMNHRANLQDAAGEPAFPFRSDAINSVYDQTQPWMQCDTLETWSCPAANTAAVEPAWRSDAAALAIDASGRGLRVTPAGEVTTLSPTFVVPLYIQCPTRLAVHTRSETPGTLELLAGPPEDQRSLGVAKIGPAEAVAGFDLEYAGKPYKLSVLSLRLSAAAGKDVVIERVELVGRP